MLDAILKKLTGEKPAAPDTEQADETHIAYAALLVEAARIDQDYAAEEAGLVRTLLARQFNLSESEASAVQTKAEKAQENANDIYQFSSRVKNLNDEEKIELVEGMWEIILSDGRVDAYEEMIMRHLIGLIHVSDQDSAKARSRAKERSGG